MSRQKDEFWFTVRKDDGTKTKRHFTPRERKKIIAYYIDQGSYAKVCNKFGISYTSARRIVACDPEFQLKYNKKREEEMQELFANLSVNSRKFRRFCDIYFDLLCEPDTIRRLAKTDPEKLTRIFAINLDNYMKINKMRVDTDDTGDSKLEISIIRKASVDDDDVDD